MLLCSDAYARQILGCRRFFRRDQEVKHQFVRCLKSHARSCLRAHYRFPQPTAGRKSFRYALISDFNSIAQKYKLLVSLKWTQEETLHDNDLIALQPQPLTAEAHDGKLLEGRRIRNTRESLFCCLANSRLPEIN